MAYRSEPAGSMSQLLKVVPLGLDAFSELRYLHTTAVAASGRKRRSRSRQISDESRRALSSDSLIAASPDCGHTLPPAAQPTRSRDAITSTSRAAHGGADGAIPSSGT